MCVNVSKYIVLLVMYPYIFNPSIIAILAGYPFAHVSQLRSKQDSYGNTFVINSRISLSNS